jgi:hypothetical protein
MSEEKVRISGEMARPTDAPILPTVNPASEKSEAPKAAAVHPAFYVMSVNQLTTVTNSKQASLTLSAGHGSSSAPVLFYSINGFCRQLASVRFLLL